MNLLLISNYKALSAKYGEGLTEILRELSELICSDLDRGVISIPAYVDIPGPYSIPCVTDPENPEQNKAAVDALYNAFQPDYMVLIGAGDIIPFQQLKDPIPPAPCGKEGTILSDLPYACDAPFSTDVTKFLAPTRKVTRLPDIEGPLTPDSLSVFIRTLRHAQRIIPKSADQYKDWWNVCTTQRTAAMYQMKNIFSAAGVKFNINVCPPCGSGWDIDTYAQMVHHHILHGAEKENILYGDDGAAPPHYPEAINGKYLIDQPREGMILLENACYGGQLYHSDQMEQMPLVNIYLSSGGIVMGSSSVTYSSTSGTHFSDYLMSHFMLSVLRGEDTGTALLHARQKLIGSAKGAATPVLLKTLAEFGVYAHAPVCPVRKSTSSGKELLGNEKQDAFIPSEEMPYRKISLSKESPAEHIQQYIAHFLFSKGIRYDPAAPPEVWSYISESSPEKPDAYGEQQKLCSYITTVVSEAGETTVYTFTDKEGSIISIDEYAAN